MIYWFIGQPGSGKSTLADLLRRALNSALRPCVHLDGDILRAVTLNQDYSREGRRRNIKCAQELAASLNAQGLNVVASFVTPYRDLREEFKARQPVTEIYLTCSAMRGREKFAALDFEPPTPEDLHLAIDTSTTEPAQALAIILSAVLPDFQI